MRDLKALLNAGNAAQMEKLQANSHKTSFAEMDLVEALEGVREEVHELYQEMGRHFTDPDRDRWDEIRHEAADVANYAHIIIYLCNLEKLMKGEKIGY